MNFVEFFSAFGLGALVVALVQAWLARKAELSKRNFEEKKEAYIGLLDALYKSETKKDDISAHLVGHWINRVELVGSNDVIKHCTKLTETNPTEESVHPDRPVVMRDLKVAMRKDLGIDQLS